LSTSLEKAVKYISDPDNLYQQFKKGSFTKDLEVVKKFSIDQAGVVKVMSNSYTGESQAYDGYGSVSYTAADVIKANTGWVTYALDQKRYYPMPIDLIEAEESLNDFVSRINGLMKYKIAADIDTYRLSKLSSQAGIVVNGGISTITGNLATDIVGSGVELDSSNILRTITTMLAYMANEETPEETYDLFATPGIVNILETANTITHFINDREITQDGVTTKIKTILTSNGEIEIKAIPDKYFHAFTLNNAGSINDAGKNLNVVGAKDTSFKFMIVCKQAVNAVVKVDTARILPNGTIRGFLGNLFELFLYHDIFAIERHAAVGTPDGTTLLTPLAFNGIIKCAFTAA
jgi:hypothetical protein